MCEGIRPKHTVSLIDHHDFFQNTTAFVIDSEKHRDPLMNYMCSLHPLKMNDMEGELPGQFVRPSSHSTIKDLIVSKTYTISEDEGDEEELNLDVVQDEHEEDDERERAKYIRAMKSMMSKQSLWKRFKKRARNAFIRMLPCTYIPFEI